MTITHPPFPVVNANTHEVDSIIGEDNGVVFCLFSDALLNTLTSFAQSPHTEHQHLASHTQPPRMLTGLHTSLII